MYPRSNYEMSERDLETIMDACKPVPCVMVGGTTGGSPQDNANSAWAALGKKMGFDHMTVRPIDGKGTRFFSAVPNETETQREEKEKREKEEKRVSEISRIEGEIKARQIELAKLRGD